MFSLSDVVSAGNISLTLARMASSTTSTPLLPGIDAISSTTAAAASGAEPRNTAMTMQTNDYKKEPWIGSHSVGSQESSPTESKDTLKQDGRRDQNHQDGTKLNKRPSTVTCGDWAYFEDTWILECLAMAFSFASLIAIIIILRIYDQQPSPNLSYGLTLNTIISLLATASRSSLLFAVAAAVGQLKWIWFQRREQPIADMQSFDDATRGPMGSLTLLFQHRGISLASLGAIVTVLAVALDPFVQQIISYPVRETPSIKSQATMPRANTFAPNSNYTYFQELYNAALWNTEFAVNPTCSSGNCTWPEYQSLGFCSKCQDVTASAILYNCDKWTEPKRPSKNDTMAYKGQTYDCPISAGHGDNGTVKIDYFGTVGTQVPTSAVWSLNELTLGNFLGVDTPVYAMAHAKFSAESNVNITDLVRNIRISSVEECVMSLCLKTYNVSVSSGTPRVDVTAVDYGQRFTNDLPNGTIPETYYANLGVDCWKPTNRTGPFNYTKLPTGNWADKENFAFCLRKGEANYMTKGFTALEQTEPFLGYATEDYGFENDNSTIWTPLDSAKSSADWYSAYTRVITYGLGSVLSDTAAALTKYTLETNDEVVTGTGMISQSFVQVSWQWLAFPSVLLVAGFAFWIATVVINRSHRLGLWKSSILPMLCHGVERDDRGLGASTTGYTTISQLARSAQATRVNLDDVTEGRLRLGRNE